MPNVDTHLPLYVRVNTGAAVTIKNSGNQTLYYQDGQKGGTVSTSVNDGTITAGASATFKSSQYLIAGAAGAQADASYASASSPSGNVHTPTAGSTTSVFVNTTFDGSIGATAYTVGDIVAALKTAGFLAP